MSSKVYFERPSKLKDDLIDASNEKVLLKKGSKINIAIAKKLSDNGLKNILVNSEYFLNKYIKSDLIDENKKETFLKSGQSIDQENLDKILNLNINSLNVADIDPINRGSYLIDTLNIDKNFTK